MSNVRVDRELCIGAGHCVRLARGAFALDAENIAVVHEPDAATLDQLRVAQDRCPAGAIFLEESERSTTG